ncbi:Putative flippase GtrA (transmembrane translocase of bactoprenol-linked glucose) [Rhizobiales bacterium GAS113]|nr:Putative flippase GtrA (transmembrane translocase of bactoprenol-linked glucose) [Rhizobiales bacterium GAS113]
MSGHRRTAPLFVLNGLLATALQYAILVMLVEIAHLGSVGLANGVASLCGIGASYFGNRFVVFRAPTATLRTLPRFLLLYGVIAVINALAMWLWSDFWGLPYTPGFVLVTGLATMVSYLGNRYFVFRNRPI